MEKAFMRKALEEARKAAKLGEVPVGAVLVHGGKIIASAHNEVEARRDASAHAEVLALQRGAEKLSDWRLNEASLYVSLEPCLMCLGAILNFRLGALYFAAYDKRQGAVGSLFDLSEDPRLPHQLKVYPELLAEESAEILKGFFASLR